MFSLLFQGIMPIGMFFLRIFEKKLPFSTSVSSNRHNTSAHATGNLEQCFFLDAHWGTVFATYNNCPSWACCKGLF
jgi:hypothetical protein